MKTKVLLRYFLQQGVDFTYYPVDISRHILEELTADLKQEFPNLVVEPLNMDYFDALAHMEQFTDRKNVAMFLGSNIGNFLKPNLERFFAKMATYFKPNDKLFLGVDLKKDPHVIIDAYSDKDGITANFNYNLLTRMNRELGANFNLDEFKHYAMYEPVTGEARSYLVSLKKQQVYFKEMDFTANFEAGECIHTEISRKYDVKGLDALAQKCGFTTEKNFFDSRAYYVNTMWKV
jgi:dimethylhistidine N-methyltransferase